MPHSISITRRRCLASMLALPAAFALRANPAKGRDWHALQATLDTFVRERRASGVGVAIRYGEAAPSYLNSGMLAFDSKLPFDEDSLCRIYSMTKHVTRTATLLLVEDGKLSLDQPVSDVLPEFGKLQVAVDIAKGLDARPATRVMTMRHLITNTSGLGNWTPGSNSGDALHTLYRERGITPGAYGASRTRPGYGAQPASLDELVARVAQLPLAYEPGTVLHYSIGFDVMALVIQRVAGVDYGEFLRRRLFEPLGMASTGFMVAPKDAARLTSNYDATAAGDNSVGEPPAEANLPPGFGISDDRASSDWLAPPRLLAGGAGLVSTSRDFLRYAQMLLGDGLYDGKRVMAVETARLVTGDIQPAGVAEPDQGVGAGSRALLRTPMLPPGSIGSGGAAGTLFWIDRERKGAVVFMSQAMYGTPARSPYQQRLFAAIEQGLVA